MILEDGTVRGGTGWGAEFAKLCNKPLYVFDQEQDGWFKWTGRDWQAVDGTPVIQHAHFTGTGTRTLHDNGKRAIETLFTKSFELGRDSRQCFGTRDLRVTRMIADLPDLWRGFRRRSEWGGRRAASKRGQHRMYREC